MNKRIATALDKLPVDLQNARLRAVRSGTWLRELRTLSKESTEWIQSGKGLNAPLRSFRLRQRQNTSTQVRIA